jgi:hypothetical protein
MVLEDSPGKSCRKLLSSAFRMVEIDGEKRAASVAVVSEAG